MVKLSSLDIWEKQAVGVKMQHKNNGKIGLRHKVSKYKHIKNDSV